MDDGLVFTKEIDSIEELLSRIDNGDISSFIDIKPIELEMVDAKTCYKEILRLNKFCSVRTKLVASKEIAMYQIINQLDEFATKLSDVNFELDENVGEHRRLITIEKELDEFITKLVDEKKQLEIENSYHTTTQRELQKKIETQENDINHYNDEIEAMLAQIDYFERETENENVDRDYLNEIISFLENELANAEEVYKIEQSTPDEPTKLPTLNNITKDNDQLHKIYERFKTGSAEWFMQRVKNFDYQQVLENEQIDEIDET